MMKMKKVLIIVAVLLLGMACQRMKAEKPKNLYSQTEIEQILHDIYLLEGEYRIRQMDTSVVNKKEWLHKEMNRIMENHHIQYNDFKDNLNYYMSNDEIAKGMLKKITEQMIEEKTILEKKQKPHKDSVSVAIKTIEQKSINNPIQINEN